MLGMLVNKLQSILLIEADFNFANKIFYGSQMLNNIMQYSFMPDENFTEQNVL